MAYPSVVTAFSTKANGQVIDASDVNNIQTDVVAIETFVGTVSSTIGTLMYDIRAAASNGGGHIQTANKGGTGQTTYTKGDLLVASSQSVLAKLAVGSDGQAPIADSTASAGISWQGVATAQTLQNQTNTYAVASVLSASVYGITFPTAVASLVAGQAFAIKWPTTNANSVMALQVSSLTALRIKRQDLTNLLAGDISASMIGIVENDGTQFQLVTPKPSGTFTNGATTKNAADASTTQNIAHGLGSVPKDVRLKALSSNNSNIGTAETIYNGTTQSSQSVYFAAGNPTVDATFTLNIAVVAGTQTGTITFDATNIIITWTKTNNPTGTYQLLWEATA